MKDAVTPRRDRETIVFEVDGRPAPVAQSRYRVERWNYRLLTWTLCSSFNKRSQAKKSAKEFAEAYKTQTRVIDTGAK